MDLATENRIAALLMKEAAELRRQAEKDGVHAYLRQPNVRGRPNSRFLTATVLGVQQANRTVEVNEMWRVRQKEQELDDRLKRRRRDESSSDRSYSGRKLDDRQKRRKRDESISDGSYREPDLDDKLQRRQRDESSSDRSYRDTEDMWMNSNNSHAEEGLRDDEIENFLNSRIKRGRGAVGSRMDETGPFLPQDSRENELGISYVTARDEWENLRQEKASKLKSLNSSEDESLDEKHKKKKASSSKQKRKHKSKDKSKDKKKKRKEERRHQRRK